MTNRTVKFRAWSGNQMREVRQLRLTDMNCWLEDAEQGPVKALMQFTGLLDKNGKEIWEGDIIESFVLLSETGENIRTVVKWGENGWLANGALSNNPQWMNNHQPEVIGNIWENPELLNHD